MASTFGARLKHAWNAFKRDPNDIAKREFRDIGQSYMYRPDRLRLTRGPDKTIIASIYNRIAMDVAAIKIEHVKLDLEGRFINTIDSPLNRCLSLEANIDQTGRTFIQDAVLTMLDSGCVAMVPIDTDVDPTDEDGTRFDIYALRVATITQWFPKHVQVDIYNEVTGSHSQYTLPKAMLAIIENPFYPIMNEPNSTMQRLIRKLTLLDAIDEQTSSGKLDMIIQLPYIIKTDEKRRQAEARRKDLERQLAESKYGVAYADGTEKIVQLNKPLENNLLSTIEYLTSMLYSQLGITTGVLDGSADENTMLNYNNRIVEPILSALSDEMKRKFLTKTARTQHQSIKFFIQPFRALPISQVADLANSLARNEIVTPNEFRQILGLKPADNPAADELHNANMPGEEGQQPMPGMENQNGEETAALPDDPIEAADDLDSQLDELEELLDHSALQHYIPTPAKYASPYYDPEKAHEYYMKNRELKERKSTARLNEKGHEVADYVKSQVEAERDSKLEAHSADTASQLETLKTNKQTQTEQNKSTTSAEIDSLKSTRDTNYENLADNKEAQIRTNQAKTQNAVNSLTRQLKAMNSEQRAARKDEILGQIKKLREQNAADRAEIETDYQEDKASEAAKFKEGSTEAREVQKSTQAVINENYSKSVSELKASSKAETAKIKDEYMEKWLTELDRIKTIPEYLKPEKTASSKTSKSTSSSSGGGSSSSRKPLTSSPTKSESSRLSSIRSHSRNVRTKLRK